jgi:hypothetical protein
LGLGISQNHGSEGSNTELIRFSLVSENGQNKGKDLLGSELKDMSQRINGQVSDEVAFLSFIVGVLHLETGAVVARHGSSDIGFKNGQNMGN